MKGEGGAFINIPFGAIDFPMEQRMETFDRLGLGVGSGDGFEILTL